jgi:Family of unknown function (DUF6191)
VEGWLSLGIPGGVLLLVAVGAYEVLRKRRHRSGPMLSEAYVNEFAALFYGTKRMELDHRDSMSMMRDEDAQGAPPGFGVDLDGGRVVLSAPNDDRLPTANGEQAVDR